MASPSALVAAERGEERRDGRPVDVVAAAFALRFEHVARAVRRGCREGFGVAAGGAVVEGVDGGEGGADAGGGGGVGQEARQVRGLWRCEDLLDLFGAGEVREDGGAFYGGAAFEVEAGGPG